MVTLALEPELLSGPKESRDPLSDGNENGSTRRSHIRRRPWWSGGGGGSCDGAALGWAESLSSWGGGSGSSGGGSGGSTRAKAGRIMGSGCMALAAALWPGGKESMWSNIVC